VNAEANTPIRSWSRYRVIRNALRVFIGALIGYFLVAYLIMPAVWQRTAARHPALDDAPRISHTKNGIPGDPLNVGLVGSERDLVRALAAANWQPADPVTFASCARIARTTAFRRPYENGPVSPLFVWSRKQDMAFEQSVGHDPSRRHHVRFWRSETLDDQGRPFWIGGATYDRKVGLSNTTLQITHHIAADVDTERDKMIQDLHEAGCLQNTYWVEAFHKVLEGRNGGGDRYHTDGKLAVGVIALPGEVTTNGE